MYHTFRLNELICGMQNKPHVCIAWICVSIAWTSVSIALACVRDAALSGVMDLSAGCTFYISQPQRLL